MDGFCSGCSEGEVNSEAVFDAKSRSLPNGSSDPDGYFSSLTPAWSRVKDGMGALFLIFGSSRSISDRCDLKGSFLSSRSCRVNISFSALTTSARSGTCFEVCGDPKLSCRAS